MRFIKKNGKITEVKEPVEILNGVELYCDEEENFSDNWLDDIDEEREFTFPEHNYELSDECERGVFDVGAWDEMSYNVIDDAPMNIRIKRGY